jgi:hypothetical protein
MALGCGQTTEVGAYANQRLNLAKLGRPMEEMPRFRTGPEKLGRPGLLGGPAKRSHGGIVNPSCNRKGKHGNPAPTAGARGFYPNQNRFPYHQNSQFTGFLGLLRLRRPPADNLVMSGTEEEPFGRWTQGR